WYINSLVYDDIDYTTVPGFESAAFIINSDNTFSQNVIFNGDLDIDYGNWDLSGSDLILYYDTEEEIQWSIDSFNSSTAFLTLVHYLNDDGNDEYTSGSATIVKQ
ncbi:lipocalin family protein, partial [Flavobacteriales bacterium]|nr:lipocalin family protein [Flavobacteriales bacterium]